MKIKKTKWFSPMGGLIGIVLAKDDITNEPKAYINKCTLGKMEEFNVDEVSGKGAKLTREDAIEIAKHFNIIKN